MSLSPLAWLVAALASVAVEVHVPRFVEETVAVLEAACPCRGDGGRTQARHGKIKPVGSDGIENRLAQRGSGGDDGFCGDADSLFDAGHALAERGDLVADVEHLVGLSVQAGVHVRDVSLDPSDVGFGFSA